MDVLGVTPNELLSGEWKYIDHTEPYIMDIIKREQDFNVSLVYLLSLIHILHLHTQEEKSANVR